MESKTDDITSVAFQGIDIEIYKLFPVSRATDIEDSVEGALSFGAAVRSSVIRASVDTLLREKYT